MDRLTWEHSAFAKDSIIGGALVLNGEVSQYPVMDMEGLSINQGG